MTIRKTKLYRTNLKKRSIQYKHIKLKKYVKNKDILNIKHDADFLIETKKKQDIKALRMLSDGFRKIKDMFPMFF